MDRPVLSLDRPFTYELPDELAAGVGSLVQVPFHGRLVRGWVLGGTEDVPARVLPVKKVVSPVRFFDERMLELLRWVSERYVAALAAVVARSHPPRVASEEADGAPPGEGRFAPSARLRAPAPVGSAGALDGYRGGSDLLGALARAGGAFVLQPAPDEEVDVAVEAVEAALAGGRSAIVLVPEARPLPATAAAIAERFGERVCLFAGGDRRARYRRWLEIADGRYEIVVGTRPAVFAPLGRVGLVYVARESHAAHREERAPYYHVRDVALARALLERAVCVMSALCPSAEAVATGAPTVAPDRRRWPPVEIVRPGPEGRAPRLVSLLKETTRGFLYEPVPGYGVARICRVCREPARCAACGGALRLEAGAVRCVVCGAAGACASCGAYDFGVVRGGVERVEEWASRIAAVPVRRSDRAPEAAARGVFVGGPEAVRDVGPVGLDLVAILDADLAARRPGLSAQERALATWMEAAAWAAPGGRVLVQTSRPNDPAVQALVSGNPDRFHRAETERRAASGFPVGSPVFRVSGSTALPAEIERLAPVTLLSTVAGEQAVCLVALDRGSIGDFGVLMRSLAERDVVRRVEAEPHL